MVARTEYEREYMPTEDVPFIATPESSLTLVRAISLALEAEDPSIGLVGRALLGELGSQAQEVGPGNALLAPALIECDRLFDYPCIEQTIEKTGYTEHIFVQIMKDLAALEFQIPQDALGKTSLITDHSIKFQLFDMVELYEMSASGSGYEAPQWMVRAGQWAYWLMTAEARTTWCRVSRAALSLDTMEAFHFTTKLGEYIRFQLRHQTGGAETHVPLLNILAEVSDVTFLETRDRNREEKLKAIIEQFNTAAGALAAEGLCSIRLLRADTADKSDGRAVNDNNLLLQDSIVAITDVA